MARRKLSGAPKDFVREGVEHDGPGQSIMVIMAHPDDAEFTLAGTIARWTGEGRTVTYVLCTSGDKGTSDPAIAPARLAITRQEEQRAACAVLGVKEVVFLGYPDGLLKADMILKRDIARQIRRIKPDAVVCQDPTRRWHGNWYLNHPDHRAAGDAALDAVYPLARDYHTLPELAQEGFMPHKVRHVYISPDPHEIDVWFDITGTIDKKIEALKCHKSQVNGDEVKKFVLPWAERTAGDHGMKYAEAFKYLKLS